MKRAAYAVLAIALVTFFIGDTISAPADPKPPKVEAAKDVEIKEGIYICRGSENGGKPYKGTVAVRKLDQTYLLVYQVGLHSFRGVGTVDDNKLLVGWTMGDTQGLSIFRLTDKISGRWAAFPKGSGTEELVFIESLSD